MVAANVSVMEEQVMEVEGEARTLPGAFKKIFRTMNVSGFLNVSNGTKWCVNIYNTIQPDSRAQVLKAEGFPVGTFSNTAVYL